MEDIKEMIKSEIHSYEHDRNVAAQEAEKQKIMQVCYNEFVHVLMNILNAIEKES